MLMAFKTQERLWINHGTAEKMNKWEKLLLLKFRPNCDANCVLSQNERAQKTYLWCQGTRLINFSNKTAYNFPTFVIAGWFTLETKNVLT